MARAIQGGPAFLERICKALGIDRPVTRVVLDIPIDGVAMAYVQQVIEECDDAEKLDCIIREMAESMDVKYVEPEAVIKIDEFGRVKT